jgi:hypothetical protein
MHVAVLRLKDGALERALHVQLENAKNSFTIVSYSRVEPRCLSLPFTFQAQIIAIRSSFRPRSNLLRLTLILILYAQGQTIPSPSQSLAIRSRAPFQSSQLPPDLHHGERQLVVYRRSRKGDEGIPNVETCHHRSPQKNSRNNKVVRLFKCLTVVMDFILMKDEVLMGVLL